VGLNGGNAVGGSGGAGTVLSISGSAIQYAGGGGGAGFVSNSLGSAGGGNGIGWSTLLGSTALANTGSGGGGAATGLGGAGYAGGSGIVIIRYPSYLAPATSTTGSPETYVSGNYRVYKFVASGTITF
jgi:hypothetical protein